MTSSQGMCRLELGAGDLLRLTARDRSGGVFAVVVVALGVFGRWTLWSFSVLPDNLLEST